MAIKTRKFDKGAVDENTYVVTDISTGKCAVIDPGRSDDAVRAVVDASSGLEYIILTHGHGDHIKELPEFREAYPEAKLIADFEEKPMLNSARVNGSKHICGKAVEDEADIYVTDGETVPFGSGEIRFIHTPGHTEGGMCILIEKALFSGDTLFRADVGRSDFPGGSWDALKDSIQNKLFLLPDDTVVYPGHGPETSIGYEKRMNPYV